MSRKIAIFSDFDNTISTHDVCVGIFDTFSWPNWRELEEKAIQCGRGSQSVLPMLLAPIRMPAHRLAEFILSQFEIDPFFLSFVKLCQERDWPLFVVSDGLDFYIKLLLGRAGLSYLNFRSNHLEIIEDKPSVEFPFADAACGRCGNCKRSRVDAVKALGYKIIYIGDGITDFCAAQSADLLFAKDALLAYCQERDISCYPFSNFHDLQHSLPDALLKLHEE
jgi:2,3-diketo-5-methylthio-1-phosphopentane phosphatase